VVCFIVTLSKPNNFVGTENDVNLTWESRTSAKKRKGFKRAPKARPGRSLFSQVTTEVLTEG
jgi:hypothetical protein